MSTWRWMANTSDLAFTWGLFWDLMSGGNGFRVQLRTMGDYSGGHAHDRNHCSHQGDIFRSSLEAKAVLRNARGMVLFGRYTYIRRFGPLHRPNKNFETFTGMQFNKHLYPVLVYASSPRGAIVPFQNNTMSHCGAILAAPQLSFGLEDRLPVSTAPAPPSSQLHHAAQATGPIQGGRSDIFT